MTKNNLTNKKYYTKKLLEYFKESHKWGEIKCAIEDTFPIEEACHILTPIEYGIEYKRSVFAPAYDKFYFLYYDKKRCRLNVAKDNTKN